MLETISNLQIAGVNVLEVVQAILTFIGSASALGIIIAKFTKTTADDAFFAKVRDLILKFALNVDKK